MEKDKISWIKYHEYKIASYEARIEFHEKKLEELKKELKE